MYANMKKKETEGGNARTRKILADFLTKAQGRA